ncbi:hypothetical protein PsorP6_002829 [Peronosclerospora sorghi]|uniref:Uncharacterized protein n=1 Tax=Peronosclerospora sorghi TaxID=230839 RepID=A0ACC0VRI8_9STRA|nr:hypothetical protein PsorP6_002829 [Peronosclerospora sorghi]
MAGTLRRFSAMASTSKLFTHILRDKQVLENSQTLFDQILPAAPCINVDESNARSGENEPDKMWALVAVVATVMTQEIKMEKEAEKKPSEGVKRTLEWNLVQLLAEAGVGLQEFLLYFTSLFNRLLLEPEVLAATTLIKEEFTIMTLLFEKYSLLWNTLMPKKQAPIGIQVQVPSDPEPESILMTQEQQREVKMHMRRSKLFEGGWFLFLLAKRRLGNHYAGLGQLYHLLLATLHLMAINVQTSQVTVEAEVAAALKALGTLGSEKAAPVKCGVKTSAQLLEALCAAPKVDPADVMRASEHLGIVLKQLTEDGVLRQEPDEHMVLSMTVFADGVLEQNVARLSDKYKKDYLDWCGKLDERFYLNDNIRRTLMGTTLALQVDRKSSSMPAYTASSDKIDPDQSKTHVMLSPVRRNMMARRRENGSTLSTIGMMTPPRHNQQAFHGCPTTSSSMRSWQLQGSPRGNHISSFSASPRASPLSMRTPVSIAVETNNWVRDTLSSTILTPVTPRLRQFFSECITDPTERISRVLYEYSNLLLAARKVGRVSMESVRSTASMVIDHEQNDDTDANGTTRSTSISLGVDDSLKRATNLSVVLFYRVLEPLLLSERKRLRNNDFSKLLNNDVFLAALFACSAEVVLKAYSLITISYPFLLEHLHVNAFHFVTTSESFVKYAPNLPSALKKHMGDVKDRILDSLVWRSDSALYQLLARARRVTTTEPRTPVPSDLPSTPSLSDGSERRGHGAENGARNHAPVLRLFYRMVFSRAATRIYQLCSLLGLDSTDQSQVWTAMKECITSHQHLLKDRHLDLIVLCNIYAVCKVPRGPNVSQAAATMSFKRLLACYKQLHLQNLSNITSSLVSSRREESVTHGIILDHENSRGDIIKFYNRCYISSMKVFILQFQHQESQMAAAGAAVAAETFEVPRTIHPGFKCSNGPSRNFETSASDAESIARAAAEAVQMLFHTSSNSSSAATERNKVLLRTPPRPTRRDVRSSPFVSSPAVAAFQLFTSAEVQMLPVSVNPTSPKRVQSSNVFMSPLQQVRLDRRSQLTPRSHALYAIGESPARDLALINRAVNSTAANLRCVRAPNLLLDSDQEHDDPSCVTTVRKKQKTAS